MKSAARRSLHLPVTLGLPELRSVGWLGAPADPECLEFGLLYPAGRFGRAARFALRAPVAASARETAIGVYRHFHGILPELRPGLAYRRPVLVIGGSLAVALAAALAGRAGWFKRSAGDRSETMELHIIDGFATAIAAFFVPMMVMLITGPWGR